MRIATCSGRADKFPYAPDRRYTPADAPKEMLRRCTSISASSAQLSCRRAAMGPTTPPCSTASLPIPGAIAASQLSMTVSRADFDRLTHGGVRGVRFNFVKHLGGAPDMGVFSRVIDRIKGRGWHVVLHLDAPDIVPLSDMIRKLPLPFIIDHMGRVPSAAGVDQPPLRALVELSRLENCWIKVCGSERISLPPYAAAVPIARRLVEAAPDRVLWGTDFPHPNATHEADEADLVDLVPQFAPDPLAQRRLLVDNPARLYGFGR